LETLEEIAMEVRDAYLEEGGTRFEYIPCLNNEPAWIEALSTVAHQHLQGWDLSPPADSELAASRTHALSLGAKN
jgi:ferrochelatase